MAQPRPDVKAFVDSKESPYPPPNRQRVLADVSLLLRDIQSLEPRFVRIMLERNVASPMIELVGTIPIYYRGAQYNIPVRVIVPPSYPLAPPKCLVTPTPDMRIKERHRHVDEAGNVYLPYLHGWNPHASNLIELVSFMSAVFGDDPPCYKAPSNPPQPQQVHHPHHHGQQHQQPQLQPQQAAHMQAQHAAQAAQAAQLQQAVQPAQAAQAAAVAAAAARQPSEAEKAKAAADRRRKDLLQDLKLNLQEAIRQLNHDNGKELGTLTETHGRLLEGSRIIEEGKGALKREADLTAQAERELDLASASLQRWLAENEGRKADVNESVVPADTWSRQ